MTPEYTFRELYACPMCGCPSTERQYFGKRLNQAGGRKPHKVQGSSTRLYRCSRCRLIYPNPIPLRTGIEYLETTGLQDFWGDRILSYEHFDHELALLPGLIGKPLKDLVVLDVGFGLGNSLANLESKCREAHGIEPFEVFFNKALEVNGAKLNKSLLKCVRFEEAVYPEEKFDFIFFEALQHLPDLEAGMRKVLAWLKPGGILYAEVPNSTYLFNRFINLYYKLLGTDFVADTNPLHGNYSYYAFSRKSFVENGRRLNYKVIFDEVYPCNPPISGVVGRLFRTIMRKTDTGMQRSIWMQKGA